MATSGQYSFTLQVGEVVDEAAERCGLDPAKLSERHLISARRSLNLLFGELEAEHVDPPYRIERLTAIVPEGMRAILLPAGTIDVLDAATVVSDTEIPLARSTRDDYFRIADKTATADRPYQYFVDKQFPTDTPYFDGATGEWDATGTFGTEAFGGGGTPSTKDPSVRRLAMVVYPRPTANVTLSYYRLRQVQDATSLGHDLDTDRLWLEPICAGLAAKMAEKFDPEREPGLRSKFEFQIARAKRQHPDRGEIVVGGRGFGRMRRGRL